MDDNKNVKQGKNKDLILGFIGLIASIINIIAAFFAYGFSFQDVMRQTMVTNILIFVIFIPLIVKGKKKNKQ